MTSGKRMRIGVGVVAVMVAGCTVALAQGPAGTMPASAPATLPAATAPAADIPSDFVKVTPVTHRKIDKCLQLSAGKTRLIVMPAWAGRISVLDFGTGNVLFTDPAVDGKIVKPQDNWGPWDGNATDIFKLVNAQKNERKNQFAGLWLHPWNTVSLMNEPASTLPSSAPTDQGGTRVEIASEVSRDAGLSARRAYTLWPDGTKLRYEYTITNRSGKTDSWTICERALVPATGYVILPIAKGGAFPEGFAARDNTKVEPADRAVVQGEFLVLRAGTTTGAGFAARLRAGWIGVVRDGHVLLMTYPIAKDGKYPYYNGANVMPWLNKNNIELEPLSPEVTLDNGKSYTFTQVWHWLAIPQTINADDAAVVGQWAEKQLIGQLVN